MNTDKFLNDNFPQDKAQQFGDILKNAITSYIDNKNNCTVDEWLHNYLTEQLPEKSADEITNITNTIISTVELHSETLYSMRDALKSGKSVESWFQETLSNDSIGQKAYQLADAHSALTEISNQYSDEQQEVIDVEVIPSEEWENSKWNRYRTKELIAETVRQAGETALKTTASDLCEKVTEYGFKNVITDKEIIKESFINGADKGLKVAVSGAVEIADSKGVLPDTKDTESRSLIACMTVENAKTFSRIAKGEIGLAQGLKEIKDTSVVTLAAIVKTKVADAGKKIGQKIGETVGTVFGPVGTAVGHFVGGAVGKMAGTAVGTKIVETVKKVSSAAKTVVSKVANTVRSFGSKVKSGLKKLFSW